VNEKLYVLVEGHGEREAAPALIRRLVQHYERYEYSNLSIEVYNAKGIGNITTHLENLLNNVFRKLKDCKALLILLDAEKDHYHCPPELAQELASQAEGLHLHFPIAIVCACCEYESWFLVSLRSIADRWLLPGTTYDGNPEEECSAKAWLEDHMLDGEYRETRDQVKMTNALDIGYAIQSSRSFRRMANAIKELLDAIDENTTVVTPSSKDIH
jgi:Domain of unknown function (DUF4276)